MSYDLSFDRKTVTLLAICTAATVFLLVAAGFLLGTQYRRAVHSTSVAPAKTPLAPAAQRTEPSAAVAPTLVEASPASVAKADSVSTIPASTTKRPLAAAEKVSGRVPLVAGYSLQFGAFREEANAEAAIKQLKEKNVKAEIAPRDDAAGNTWYTVRFGDYPTLSAASVAAIPLRASTQRSIFVRPSNRP